MRTEGRWNRSTSFSGPALWAALFSLRNCCYNQHSIVTGVVTGKDWTAEGLLQICRTQLELTPVTRRLRRRSATARLLVLRVLIPPGYGYLLWMLCVVCEELISRSKEWCRVCVCIWHSVWAGAKLTLYTYNEYVDEVRLRRKEKNKETQGNDFIRLKKLIEFKKNGNGKAGNLYIGPRIISVAGVLTCSVSIRLKFRVYSFTSV